MWLLIIALTVAYAHASPRPHIVSLFLDDAGFGDVGFNDATVVETPHMDALAASGMALKDMHAGASVCTPSRAALMMGRYPIRAGVAGNFGEESLYGLAEGELTLANILSAANYSTQMIGKHHLGTPLGYSPTSRGFDTWFGLPYSGDMGCLDSTPASCRLGKNRSEGSPACPALCPPDSAKPTPGLLAIPLYDSTSPDCSGHASCDDDIITAPYDPMTLNAQYVARAESIIANHAPGGALAGTPLFLHVAFAHTHTPLAYAAAFTNSSSRPGLYRPFGDVLAEVDAAIGDIVAALEAAGMRDDTLIVLASDNGPADLPSVACEAKGSPGPYLGLWQKSPEGGGGGSTAKTTTWSGGHHVMGAASWPKVIRPGSSSDALVSTMDYMTTFAGLAGATLPTDRVFDGIDLMGVFQGDDTQGHRTLFHPDHTGNLTAGRVGKYSVYWETAPAGPCLNPDGTHAPSGKAFSHSPPLAFDVLADPGESTPVTLPADLLAEVEAARTAALHSIASTFHTSSNYANGGTAAWACGNRKSSCCRVKPQ